MRILLDESLPRRLREAFPGHEVQYQQNLSGLPLSIAILAGRDNRYETLLPLAAQLLPRLPALPARTLTRCDG